VCLQAIHDDQNSDSHRFRSTRDAVTDPIMSTSPNTDRPCGRAPTTAWQLPPPITLNPTVSTSAGCLPPTLRGAGAQDALLLRQTAGRFRASLAGKVGGLLALDAALGGAPLAAALLFSSVSAIVAPLGQPNYAAANAALNAWATGRGAQARAACELCGWLLRLQADVVQSVLLRQCSVRGPC